MTNSFYSNILKLESFASKYPTIESLVETLYLQAILEAYRHINDNEKVDGLLENDIRNKFTHHFKHHSSFLKKYINNRTIFLTKENEVYTRDETQRTDIEFFSSGHGNIFVVECKRLKSAETRYVNGMEKFIELSYSEKDNYAGMLGFIIKGKPKKIVETLRSKVKNFHPSNGMEEIIKQKCVNWELSFKSKHVRKNEINVQFYHLFFDFID
ncbi:hypothetical protein KY334_04265 [Candidatus Woesearchaeota archaeon]|nr:hypothetical protein [Candidatus Woesearchaeota archaeon]